MKTEEHAIADAEVENQKLKARITDLERATTSAKDMVDALNGLSDYETWNHLLSKLERDLARL
jgi:hypothetical protein